MKLNEAVEQVLQEHPSTEEHKADWLFFVKVLERMGYVSYVPFDKNIPSPDSIMRVWRMHNQNREKRLVKKGTILTKYSKAISFQNSNLMP